MNIFLISRSRFRRLSLNNFQNEKKFGNYKLYNFIGPVLFYLVKILLFLKLGKAISLDGNPILKSKQGINLWMKGTNLKIPKKFRNLKNNFVNMKNIFLKHDRVFQIYPLNIKNYMEKKKPKIIYISDINITNDTDVISFWEKNKIKLLKNFATVDDINFWKQFIFFKNKELCFSYYKKIKYFLRLEIIKKLKIRYKKNFLLIGQNWLNYEIDSEPNIFNNEIISKIYNGNICIDLGSAAGSLSLYPRSINIIESGGILIQLKQNDYNNIWRNSKFKNNFLFTSFEELFLIVDKILSNKNLMENIYHDHRTQFERSHWLIQKQFNSFFYAE
jgi:hypothetical protein